MKRSGKKRNGQRRSQRGKTAKSRTASRAGSHGGSSAIREQIVKLLDGEQAYAGWRGILAGIPFEKQGVKPAGAPHTPWQLLEHLRIAQWDILEFSRDPKHISPQFPEGYWPESDAPPSAQAWEKSVEAFGRDLQELKRLIMNPRADLLACILHGEGQTIFREALLAADHNAYHLGQMVLLRKMLGAWEED